MDRTTSLAPASRHSKIDNQHSAWQFNYGYYRIVIPELSCVKYLALPNPAISFPDLRGEKLSFTTIPDGDWNIGYLTSHDDHTFSLSSTEKATLAGISKTWHPSSTDWMALNEPEDSEDDADDLQLSDHLFARVSTNHFGFEKVVVKYEWNPETVHGVDLENKIYELIDGHQIAPKFLAHVTETNGGESNRVIGFMVEKVLNARKATLEDLPACKEVLNKLHALGIAHGSLLPEHFLIIVGEKGRQEASNTRALLQSFTSAYESSDQNILDKEMNDLEPAFQQAAITADEQQQHERFSLNLEMSDLIRAISLRDGGLHPRVIQQAREGAVTITGEEHKLMLAELKAEEIK